MAKKKATKVKKKLKSFKFRFTVTYTLTVEAANRVDARHHARDHMQMHLSDEPLPCNSRTHPKGGVVQMAIDGKTA